jgi:polar amino acid transport system substrate-binding protein
MTSTGLTAGDIAEKHGFAFAVETADQIMQDSATDVVLIGTRHDSHAQLVRAALLAGKHVYVEKPLAVSKTDLLEVLEAYEESEAAVMVGFNRRHAPLVEAALTRMQTLQGPRTIVVRVNAGAIPSEHWIQQIESGGGRIVGEVCHFVDLAACLAGCSPTTVFAMGAGNQKSPALQDSLCVSIGFENGSIASVIYCADGDTAAGKELVEVMVGGVIVRIDDFRTMQITEGGKSTQQRLQSVDKGHSREMAALVELARGTSDASGGFASAVRSTLATLAVIESLACGAPVHLDRVTLADHE